MLRKVLRSEVKPGETFYTTARDEYPCIALQAHTAALIRKEFSHGKNALWHLYVAGSTLSWAEADSEVWVKENPDDVRLVPNGQYKAGASCGWVWLPHGFNGVIRANSSRVALPDGRWAILDTMRPFEACDDRLAVLLGLDMGDWVGKILRFE